MPRCVGSTSAKSAYEIAGGAAQRARRAQLQHRIGAVVAPLERRGRSARARSPRSPGAPAHTPRCAARRARTSPQVSLPSASLSRSSATSRSRKAMSQRTSSWPGAGGDLQVRVARLVGAGDAGHERAERQRRTACQARRSAPPRRLRARIDAPIVQADRRLEAARFLDRVGPAARSRRLREDEQVERLALARDVAARERERARGRRARRRARTSPARGHGRCSPRAVRWRARCARASRRRRAAPTRRRRACRRSPGAADRVGARLVLAAPPSASAGRRCAIRKSA